MQRNINEVPDPCTFNNEIGRVFLNETSPKVIDHLSGIVLFHEERNFKQIPVQNHVVELTEITATFL